jgi:hypothetical protein
MEKIGKIVGRAQPVLKGISNLAGYPWLLLKELKRTDRSTTDND